MSSEHPLSRPERMLSVAQLRELIREARRGFAPDHVARVLRHPEPGALERDAPEIAELLRQLVDTAAGRLRDAGVEPDFSDRPDARRLPKREREYASNLGVLYTELSCALMLTGQTREALAAGLEGLAWCRAAADHWQMSVQWRALTEIHAVLGSFAESSEACNRAVEAARASGDVLQILAGLSCSALHHAGGFRPDEADAAIAEAFELMQRELPNEESCPHYGSLLTSKARARLERSEYVEGIHLLRQALRWAVPELYPFTRTMALTQLGAVYQMLAHFRQAIECQHEMIRVAQDHGMTSSLGWAYLRLGRAYVSLKQFTEAAGAFDHADDCMGRGSFELLLSIAAERSELLLSIGRYDDAMALCRRILDDIGEKHVPYHVLFVTRRMARIEMRRQSLAAAEEHFRRALAVAEEVMPQHIPHIRLDLARAIHAQGRNDEAEALVVQAAVCENPPPQHELGILRLRAALAEARGDLRTVVDCEREAGVLEREMLERQAELEFRNARIIAEVDLLERQAELERERRLRVERELADAIVELGDRRRSVQRAQQRLRTAIAERGSTDEVATTRLLRDTLASLRKGSRSHDIPLQVVVRADDEFLARLRERWPDLTPKQQRLCALLRAGQTSQEIGTLMDLEPEGLKAQRKRLRKRLGLAPDDSLERVIAEV